MSEKIITIKRILKPKYRRKVSYNTTYKISIPIEWIQFFKIRKGQEIELLLKDNGFFINLTAEDQQKENEKSKGDSRQEITIQPSILPIKQEAI